MSCGEIWLLCSKSRSQFSTSSSICLDVIFLFNPSLNPCVAQLIMWSSRSGVERKDYFAVVMVVVMARILQIRLSGSYNADSTIVTWPLQTGSNSVSEQRDFHLWLDFILSRSDPQGWRGVGKWNCRSWPWSVTLVYVITSPQNTMCPSSIHKLQTCIEVQSPRMLTLVDWFKKAM